MGRQTVARCQFSRKHQRSPLTMSILKRDVGLKKMGILSKRLDVIPYLRIMNGFDVKWIICETHPWGPKDLETYPTRSPFAFLTLIFPVTLVQMDISFQYRLLLLHCWSGTYGRAEEPGWRAIDPHCRLSSRNSDGKEGGVHAPVTRVGVSMDLGFRGGNPARIRAAFVRRVAGSTVGVRLAGVGRSLLRGGARADAKIAKCNRAKRTRTRCPKE